MVDQPPIHDSSAGGEQSESTPRKKFSGGYGDHTPRNISVNYGYSRFIRFFRKFMVLLAVGFIAAVAVWMSFYNDPKTIKPEQDQATAPQGEAALVTAQFDGIDNQGRPYRVTADRAVRSTDNTDLIDMTNPMADLLDANNKWLAGTADTGQFDQSTSLLNLRDNVKLYYDDGMEFTLESVLLNLQDTSATSNQPVRGQGPSGRINGQALNIMDGGNMIIIKGPATMRLRTAGNMNE